MTEPFKSQHENYYGIEDLTSGVQKVTAGFTTRHGGCSKVPFQSLNLGLHVNDEIECVIENRNRLAKAVGTELDQWVFADQVHGNAIHNVTSEDSGKGSKSYNSGIMERDGLYTKESNIVLALAYADCVPIYFTSEKNHLVGIAHAGWKGTVQGIASRMIELWVNNEGAELDDIKVYIGPSIQKCCYEVDERVITQVDQAMPTSDLKPYTPNPKDKYQLSLQLLNKQILVNCGVREENIHVSTLCTSCHVENFFSHRKENGSTGRMLGFIMMND